MKETKINLNENQINEKKVQVEQIKDGLDKLDIDEWELSQILDQDLHRKQEQVRIDKLEETIKEGKFSEGDDKGEEIPEIGIATMKISLGKMKRAQELDLAGRQLRSQINATRVKIADGNKQMKVLQKQIREKSIIYTE